MSKRKENGQQEKATAKILLTTALIKLIEAVIDLFKDVIKDLLK